MAAVEQDVEVIVRTLQERYPAPKNEGAEAFGWLSPPLDVLDCVLSLNRQYDAFCLPRVENFKSNHPEVVTLGDLRALIDSYASPFDFSVQELNYRDGRRAETLLGVVKYLIEVQRHYRGETELERLRCWAQTVEPNGAWTVGVRGFGLAGFQYMRMLLGAQTVKPDIHICDFVSGSLGRKVSAVECLQLIEIAIKKTGRPATAVDYSIWRQLSSGRSDRSPRFSPPR